MHKVEPKHKLSFDEFIKAVKGEPFNQTEWFYTAKGNDIEMYDIDPAILSPEQNYIVCNSSEILKVDGYSSLFLNDLGHVNKLAFIFYECVLPDIILEKCEIGAWLFCRSVAGHIVVEKSSFGGDISVVYSKVGDISVRESSECGYVWVELSSEAGTISFDSGSKGDYIEVLNGSKCGDIVIEKNSKVNSIDISSRCEVANINIKDHGSVGYIDIYRSKTEHISITEISDCGNVFVTENSLTGDIIIRRGSRVEDVLIRGQSQCNNILIGSNSQSKSVYIDKGSESGDIRIKYSHVGQITVTKNNFSVYLFNAVVPFMRLIDCCIHELAWIAGMKGELYMDGGKLNHLKLCKTAILKDAVFFLNNVRIFIVQMQELLVHGQLVFRNVTSTPEPFDWGPDNQHVIQPEKYKYKNDPPASIVTAKQELLKAHSDNYKIKLSELSVSFSGRETPLFCIVDSSLGKTEITGCDLEKFHFEYRDSKLLETFFSGTRLPKKNIKIYKEDPESKLPFVKYYGQKVSIYNQLKKIFDNQGDLVESTWYHAKAMEYQEKLVKEDFKQEGKLFNEQWFDLKRFWLNKITNNHGESWRLALWFILKVSIGAYSLYYLSLHYKEPFSLAAWDRFVSNYILFLDPTHKIDFHVAKNALWFFPVLLDFAGRILIAYGIYQFIAAFRKHSRKTG